MASRVRLLVLLTLCVAAGYFAGQALWERASPPPEPTPPPPAQALSTVPTVELDDIAGGRRSLQAWSGKAMVINFWATWCAPCRKEMPLLEQVHQQWRERGLAVVGIAIDRPDPVRTFIGEAGVSYPILYGERDAMDLAERFAPGFPGLPLTVVAAPDGTVLTTHVGELHPPDFDRIVAALDELLAGRISAAEARKRLSDI